MHEVTQTNKSPDAGNYSVLSVIVAPFAGLLIATVVFFVPQFLRLGDIPGNLGDARFNLYILEHVYRWLSGLEPSLLSPPMFFPYPFTLGFSDTHFGSEIFYAVFRLVGLGTFDAFKAWIVTGYVLTFLAAYFVLLRLSRSPWLAAIGAFGFAFSLPAIAQIDHAQLTYRFAAPFSFLFALRYAENKKPASLYGLIAAVSLQILINVYLGLFTLMISAIAFAIAIFVRQPDILRDMRSVVAGFVSPMRNRANHRAIVVVPSLFLFVSALAMLAFYAYVSMLYGFTRHWGEIAGMVPRLWSYFIQDSLPYWAPISHALPPLPSRNEHQLFLGIPTYALFAAAVVFAFARARTASADLRILVLATLATGVLMLSVGSVTLYAFVGHLPGFNALRAVGRYILIGAFPIMTAIILLLTQVRIDQRWRALAASVLMLWMATDLFLLQKPGFPSQDSKARTDTILAQIGSAQLNPSSVLAYGGDQSVPFYVNQIDAMLVAQELGISTMGGYSGTSVPGQDPDSSCLGFAKQLQTYDLWAFDRGLIGLSALDFKPLTVGLENCDLSVASIRGMVLSEGSCLGVEDAKLISLSDAHVTQDGSDIRVSVLVHNGSSMTLHALSPNALRLSWRFAVASDPIDVGWDPRIDLGEDLAPGETREVFFSADARGRKTGSTLQIIFVVEHRFWAYGIGINPIEAQ